MPVKKQSKGVCAYCEQEISKGGMSKHLAACTERKKFTEESQTGKAASEMLYHLRVQDAGPRLFWLDLEVRGQADLEDLDHYLRSIWLECCGHMSQFSFGRWIEDEISMKRKIAQVFQSGAELRHIYDFGSSTETSIKLVAT